MPSNIDLVQHYYNAMIEALTALNEHRRKVVAKQAQVNELQRQIDYHLGRGDNVNANVVKGQIVTPTGELAVLKTQQASLQQAYDDAEKIYQQKSAQLLTDEQKKILDNKVAVEEEKIKVSQAASALEEKTKQLMQGTTKYLIWGGIALVVIVVVIVVMRKSLAA